MKKIKINLKKFAVMMMATILVMTQLVITTFAATSDVKVIININTRELGDSYEEFETVYTNEIVNPDLNKLFKTKLTDYTYTDKNGNTAESSDIFFDRSTTTKTVDYKLNKNSYVGVYANGKEYGAEYLDNGKIPAALLVKITYVDNNNETKTIGVAASNLKASTLNSAIADSKDSTIVINYYFAQLVNMSVDYGYDTVNEDIENVNQIFSTQNKTIGVNVVAELADTDEYTFEGWKLNGTDYVIDGDALNAKIREFSANNMDLAKEVVGEDGVSRLQYAFTSVWKAVEALEDIPDGEDPLDGGADNEEDNKENVDDKKIVDIEDEEDDEAELEDLESEIIPLDGGAPSTGDTAQIALIIVVMVACLVATVMFSVKVERK